MPACRSCVYYSGWRTTCEKNLAPTRAPSSLDLFCEEYLSSRSVKNLGLEKAIAERDRKRELNELKNRVKALGQRKPKDSLEQRIKTVCPKTFSKAFLAFLRRHAFSEEEIRKIFSRIETLSEEPKVLEVLFSDGSSCQFYPIVEVIEFSSYWNDRLAIAGNGRLVSNAEPTRLSFEVIQLPWSDVSTNYSILLAEGSPCIAIPTAYISRLQEIQPLPAEFRSIFIRQYIEPTMTPQMVLHDFWLEQFKSALEAYLYTVNLFDEDHRKEAFKISLADLLEKFVYLPRERAAELREAIAKRYGFRRDHLFGTKGWLKGDKYSGPYAFVGDNCRVVVNGEGICIVSTTGRRCFPLDDEVAMRMVVLATDARNSISTLDRHRDTLERLFRA